MAMKIINHGNEFFRLNVLGYKLAFDPELYFANNWLRGTIGISKEGYTRIIRLECLQTEELVQLSEWIEQLADKKKRSQTTFSFIDPTMQFRLWRRGQTETIRFISRHGRKEVFSWEMILNEENVHAFKFQISEILLKYPVR
jgi:hypothetical protein